ncbi:MAG: hypothetical protein ACI8S6_003120 [Myxococcota bacterium]
MLMGDSRYNCPMKAWPILLATTVLLGIVGERRTTKLWDGSRQTQQRHADRLSDWILRRAGAGSVDSPGGARFDGEWSLVTCQLALIGFAQVTEAHPELQPRYQPASRACADWLVTDAARQFGTAAWGEDGLASLHGAPEHAYLGYVNAALGAHRRLEPDTPHAPLHDALTASLSEGLSADIWRFETYPGEIYPADLAVVAGSIAAHDRATGGDHSAHLADWSRRLRATAVDPKTGMLYQSLRPDGSPGDLPRGSGTALAAWFLADVDRALSADLYEALGKPRLLGFGGIREYPPGVRGLGDIDSGPVISGVSVAATGFGIAAARSQGDEEACRRLVRTSTVFGLPVGGWHLTGGGIGNAIMLAMLTAEAR